MASKKTKVVVNSNGKNIDHAVAAAGQAPLKIKVQKGAKYLLKGDDGFAPENVTLTRVGADLHVTLEGETSPSLVLEGYYAQSEPVGLYGVAEDGQLYAYTPTDTSSDTRVQADASGDWTYTPAGALVDGGHSFSAVAVNKAGTASVPSASFGFTVDTTAPTQTATVADIGKDSGFSDADYLTNDGSAGRLLQGNLSAALAKGETLQVSTDGGTTWKAAFVSGAQWSAQDDSSHAGNWTVQTRVVDDAGNVGAVKSQAITLDTEVPNAPTSVVVSGVNTVDVSFDKANAKAGDRIHINVDGRQFDYLLTAVDILAGKASVANVLIGAAQLISTSIVDQAGNVSLAASVEIKNVVEEFDQEKQLNIEKLDVSFGRVVRESGFLSVGGLVNYEETLPTPGILGIGDQRNSNSQDVIRFDLNHAATKITIDLGADNGGANYFEFYDGGGVSIGKVQVNASNSNPYYKSYVFVAPNGKAVSYFKYFANGEA